MSTGQHRADVPAASRLGRVLPSAGAPSGAPAAPSRLRSARWTVPVSAAVALLVLASVVGVAAAVRTAKATPGVPVPERLPATESPAPTGETAAPAAAPSASAAGGTASASAATGAAPTGEVVVHVVGAVGAPGLVTLRAGARVADALEAAGGTSADADLARVNLARPLVDGEQVVVPRPGDPAPTVPAAAGGAAAAPGPLDLNVATLDQLDELPGIGPVLAQRIVDWRDAHGAFASVGELAEVSGIGDAVLTDVEPLVTVG